MMKEFSNCLYCYDSDELTLYVFDRYLVAESKIEFCDVEFFIEAFNLVKKHYRNKPFAYISNRVNSVAISPMIYEYINNNIPNMVAVAVVGYSFLSENIFDSELQILRKDCPHKFFKDIDRAIEWVTEELDKIE